MPLRRTSLILDEELVDQAAEVLGTTSKTDTVRSALEGAVRRAHVKNLIAWELPDAAMDELDAQRRPREFT